MQVIVRSRLFFLALFLVHASSGIAADDSYVANTVVLPTQGGGITALFEYSTRTTTAPVTPPAPAALKGPCSLAADQLNERLARMSTASEGFHTKMTGNGVSTSSFESYGVVNYESTSQWTCSLSLTSEARDAVEVVALGKMTWKKLLKKAQELYRDERVIAVAIQQPFHGSTARSKLVVVRSKL